MARNSTKTTNGASAKAGGAYNGVRHELWAVIVFALAAILLISLFTYQPADDSSGSGREPVDNAIGKVGAGVAQTALQGFGYSAYLVVAALCALGVVLAMRREIAIKLKETAGFFLIVFFCSVLLHLLLTRKDMAYYPGGWVGSLAAVFGEPLFGALGLGIIAGVGLVVAIVLATGVPPIRTALVFGGCVWRWLTALGRGILLLLGWSVDHGKAAIERRRAAKAEAADDIDAEPETRTEEDGPPEPVVKELPSPEEAFVKAGPVIVENGKSEPEPEAPKEPKPPLLDRGEKEVVITVRRLTDASAEEDEAWPPEAGEEMETEDEEAAAPGEEEAEETAGEAPEAKPRRRKAKAEGPQIVDQRPRRQTADEIGDEAIKENERREYQLPPVSLLDYPSQDNTEIDREQLYGNARLLEQTLLDYKIEGKVKEIHPGPVITMYEFAPARGTKLSRIATLEDDLAMALAALKVRIVAPIPGKSVVGIEVPNLSRETVYLKEIIGHKQFAQAKSPLTIAIGKDIFGYPVVSDLQKMPHLLIAGATGAGKSVGVNGMILSILYRNTPDEVKFILVDPKRLEFNFYEGIPHLLLPVITDPKQASLALGWVVHEMDTRYQILSEWGVKNMDSYNRLVGRLEEASQQRGGDIETLIADFSASEGGDMRALARKLKSSPIPTRMPFIVVVIDELADLMMVAGKEVELSIARLAQLARASGIHLIVATQRPSTDVITGLIKNNFPARISFRVSQKVDSRVILDRNGAESLLGRGDMLFLPGGGDLMRLHGAYVSEEETARVVDFIRVQRKPAYKDDILTRIEEQAAEQETEGEAFDSEYDHAVALVCETGKASISLIQRKLRVGYNRAARMIERMEDEGVVGPSDGVKGRPVYGRPTHRNL
ncbi:MAG: DNA translocase FtsK [Myxococcales bacterium]|nr:MAG: DNA translocase FtsK [Myxococcales bacterium]